MWGNLKKTLYYEYIEQIKRKLVASHLLQQLQRNYINYIYQKLKT